MPRTSVAVFARAPVPGKAKTRLVPRLGAVGAATLQRLLAERALRTAIASNVGHVYLWCWPDAAHAFFAQCRTTLHVRLRVQRGSDLGARMHDAFTRLCATGPALLIGTDCPALAPADLCAAAAALGGGNDAVVVPAEDGGYVLIGLRRPLPMLFDDMPWGTDQVMSRTRERLRAANVAWRELPSAWDVDRPADFDRLLASGLMPGLTPCVAEAPRA
jgi:rSAM/selenodomain-associated transferase 1